MKILLWTTHYLPCIGGLENLAHSLAIQFQKMGHQVRVITNGEKFSEYEIDGVKVHTFPLVTTTFKYDLPQIKKISQEIDTILEDFSPDVANVHGWFECFAFYQFRTLSKRKIPLCITIHGLLEQKSYQTEACTKLWSMAKSISTVSHAISDELKEHQLSHPSLQVIHNGLAIPTEPTVPLKLDPPQLLMIGRLSQEKCFDMAFHAMKILIKNHPRIKLRLVGGGPEYHNLMQLKTALGLDAHIEMTDFIPPHKVREHLDAATLVLIPSNYESFCLVALEAACRKRPVIASGVYGLKEVIDPSKTGLLIEPNSPSAIAEAVEQLLKEPKKMVEMGNRAYERAVSLFSIETTAKKYQEMYEAIR